MINNQQCTRGVKTQYALNILTVCARLLHSNVKELPRGLAPAFDNAMHFADGASLSLRQYDIRQLVLCMRSNSTIQCSVQLQSILSQLPKQSYIRR